MASVNLLDVGLPQTFTLLKKKKAMSAELSKTSYVYKCVQYPLSVPCTEQELHVYSPFFPWGL